MEYWSILEERVSDQLRQKPKFLGGVARPNTLLLPYSNPPLLF